MVDYNTEFNTSGKFPTMEDFWQGDLETWVTSQGITPEFSRVLGEQVFAPLKDPITPFYNTFAGRPLDAGAGWSERIIGKKASKRFKPKATAQDALGFFDSEGLEFNYEIDVEGWRPVSLPSDLVSIEMFLQRSGIGELNSRLVDEVIRGYQRDMESIIGMKAISTTSKEQTLDAATSQDPQAILKAIQRFATQFRGDASHFNELNTDDQAKVYTNSERVLVFMGEELYNDIMDSFATLPSPDRIVRNAEIITVPDGLPTPLTTAQFNEGVVDESTSPETQITTWTPATKPVAIDKAQPAVWMCSARRVEYRPVIGEYYMEMQRNTAGRFTNEHLCWRGAVGIRPYENALRINLTESP